ncbi:hypothetical protein Btru_038606 [Bulinus truncatus]|nr:hypothetical protein Btru_038606 [Bulinus truncatus]
MITLNGVQKLFLEKPEVLHEIRSMNHEIDFCDPDKMLIKENSSTQGFSDYVNTLVVLEKIEFEKIHTASLNKFLSSFNLQHKLCFAVALQNTIHFLCLRHELVLGSKDILIKSIKDTLQEMQDDNKGAVSSSQENIASHEESLSINEHTDRRQHKGIKINPFFLWLLNELHLQEALRFTFQGIGVKIDFEKSKIKIENFDNSLHICLEIVKICDEKQDSLSDNAQQFLKKGSIMNYIKEKIDFLRYHFVVHQENSFACVRDRQNKEIHFGEFLSGVMLRNNIISLKYQNSQFSPHLLKFIEHFNVEISPDHCLILEGANIILYTVLVYDVSIISQILESFFSHMPEDLVKYVSTHCYFSKLEKNISQVECKLTEYQYEYCKIFLDVHNLKELINFELQHKGLINFELQQDKLIIICIYRYRHSILGYFKSFTENLMQEIHDFDICGLTEFALLNEGHKIISEISQSSKCYIAIPTDKIKLVTDFEDIKAETKDYKVILIQTAKFEGLHIHLVQGKIDDLETSMSILFQPTQNPTFSFQHLKTRSHAIVLLVPAWFANGQDFTNLNKLRKSFETWIYAVFDQAKLHQCFTIAFSTEKMHDSEYPFPLDVLAKTVLECLFQKVSSLNASAGATSITENYDIYICEPYHESVFKAFQYFMDTLYNTKFDTPDQEKWDKISPTCTSKYSGQLHNTVTIKSSNPSTVTQNVLFCYPISPSLKVSTCPVVNEKDCSSRMLEDSVKRYEDSCPDGIPLNGHFPARCFQYTYKDVMLYCCPEWGLNASKVIYDSLNVCLFQATNKNAVHIVPPGTYASKYPAKYLAQAVFKAVDMFLQEGIVQKHLHIVFILEDQDYREAFDKELAKCQTNKNKRSIINTLMSYVWPPLGYHSKAEPSSVKSEVEKTSVIFVSESAECVSKAVTQLYSKLIELMSYNKEVIDVSEDELGIWKDFISKEHKHPVVLVLIDAKKMNRKKKKKHSSKRMVSITGLHKQWIADFKNVILRQSNPKQLSNSTAILNTNAPNVKYKSSSVDKCNHIKSCKGNVKQESLANYKKDKDELTMSSSSPESLESSQKLSITKSEDENCEFTGEFKKNELDSFDDKKGKADFKNSSSSSPESLESSQKLSITKSEDENCEFTGELKKNELDSFDDKKGKADFKNSSSSSPESLESSQKLSITKNEDENCEYTGELKKNELDSFDDKKGKADFKNSSSSSPESLESSQKLSITKSEDENCEFTGELKKNELDSFDDKKGKGDFKNSSRSHVSKKRSRKSNFPESEDKNCEYTWKVENTENDCFEEVDPQKNEYFEKIYLKDKAPNKKFRRDLQVWKPFLKIDFFNMIILSEGHQTVKIIRSEKIKEEDNIIFPKHWKKFDDETLHLIESEHLEVENYIKELKNNFEIIKIEEVQNKDLYSRFQSKRNLMPNAEQKMLLHMASEDSVKKVCKFGFQRTFSAFLTEFSGIGEGVAFTSSVDTCYQNYKNKTTQDISLFIAAVVTGESAPSTEKRYSYLCVLDYQEINIIYLFLFLN